MNDEAVDLLLDNLLQDRIPVGDLYFSTNLLTRVPPKIPLFTKLDQISLEANRIVSIEYGAFNFSVKLRSLSLLFNRLTRIEAGAFQGIIH